MKKYILLIDDEAPIRELLALCLNERGYRAEAVASAAEALSTVRKESPNLIISDLQLEDADGLEMIAQLKLLVPNTPVILLTGVLFDAEVVRDILHKNVAAYLEKTSSLERILDAVRRLIGPPDETASAKP